LCVVFTGLNVKNAMVLTKLNTIGIWYDATKQTLRPTLSNSKLPKEYHTYRALDIFIAKVIIKQIAIYAHSGNIDK